MREMIATFAICMLDMKQIPIPVQQLAQGFPSFIFRVGSLGRLERFFSNLYHYVHPFLCTCSEQKRFLLRSFALLVLQYRRFGDLVCFPPDLDLKKIKHVNCGEMVILGIRQVEVVCGCYR